MTCTTEIQYRHSMQYKELCNHKQNMLPVVEAWLPEIIEIGTNNMSILYNILPHQFTTHYINCNNEKLHTYIIILELLLINYFHFNSLKMFLSICNYACLEILQSLCNFMQCFIYHITDQKQIRNLI